MDDNRQIEAELQHNFHLLECSPLKLLYLYISVCLYDWTDLHQNFTRYSGISGTI